ncbi:LOW QUALITY PROTEIN: uncharacterized protein ACR2FA_008364 [Aphomia sociella]
MCFYCGDDLANYGELRKHTKAHGFCSDRDRALRLVRTSDAEVKIDVSDVTCELCNEIFSSFDEIVTHLTFKHKLPYNKEVELIISQYRLVDLKCLLCEESFKYFSKLITHVNNRHPINCFLCHQCNQKFNKKRDLESHLRTHHRKEYQCTKCSVVFSNNAALQKHKSHSHTSTCNICFETFSSNSKRLKHMKLEHISDGVLQCGFCFKTLSTKLAFLNHAAKCNVKDDSKTLDESITIDDAEKKASVSEIRNNIACILNMSTAIPFKYFMNRFRCFYCPKDFTECDDLKDHTVVEHPLCDIKLKCLRLRNREDGIKVKVDISSLSCKMCFETMQDLDALINHIISEHKAQYIKSVDNNIQPFKLVKENFSCPFCGEVYRYFGILLKHVSRSHTDNKIICVFCGKSFRTDPSLRAHISRRHKPNNYKCEFCELEFSTSNALQIHCGRVHGTKIAECLECSEKFTSQYWMQRHMINVHGTGHKCSYCGKLFTKNSHMVNHVRRTHLKEKNVQCSVCFERFFDVQHLRTHTVKHVGERNFHCDFCGKKFLWKKNLRAHMSSHIKNLKHNLNCTNRLVNKTNAVIWCNYSKNNLFSDEFSPGPYEACASERRRKNLKILFNNTTIMPFKWRGKFLCFYCAKAYTQYQDFRKHTKSHGHCTTKDYSLKIIKGNHIEIKLDISEIACEICNEPFENLKEIVEHLIGKHNLVYDKTVDIPFQEYKLVDFRCLYCDEQFTYFGYLVNHVNVMHPQNSFICDDCGATFNKKRDMALHLRNYHRQGGYPCDQCAQNFETYYLLRTHQNTVHYRKCKKCNMKFVSLTLLQKHIRLEHPQDGTLKCSFCAKEFRSSQGLSQHISKCKVKTSPQLELQDSASFISDHNLEPKKKQNILQIRQNIQCVLNMSTAVPFKFFSKYTCFYCSKKFVEFDELREHTTIEHPVCDLKSKSMRKCKGERVSVKIDIASLACKVCCQSISELDLLIDHLISEHKANYDKSVTGCLEPFRVIKDNMPCPVCPEKAFRYFGILLRHMNSEHSNNNRICDFCGRCFRNVANLNVHISYTHTGSCECNICGIQYKNQWCLARHRARKHNAKDYKCPKCPDKFPSQYHKQKHLIKVHDIGHKCTYCGKMFTRNSFMKDHIRRTHLREKNVPCSVCNERFFDNYLLRMHMVKHEGERKFVCAVCGKAFLRKSNLHSHMDMHKRYGHLQS